MADAKKPQFTPLDCDEIARSIQLCNGVEYLLDEFQREILGKEPNQLHQLKYKNDLIKIADNLEELLHHLTYIAGEKKKEFYFDQLYAILKRLNSSPNTLIITAYYLDPDRKFKRFVNRHTFEFEIDEILKKIQFTKSFLQSLYTGRKAGLRSINRAC